MRQTYKRLSKLSLQKQGRYSHARQMKRARRETKRLKVFLGCLTRDIERKIMVTTSKGNWIVGIDALHGNPYDGHTFKDAMDQAERITGQKPEHMYSDKEYCGAVKVPGTILST